MSASGASGNSELRLSMTTSSSAHSARSGQVDSPQPALLNAFGDGTQVEYSAVGLNTEQDTGTGQSTPAGIPIGDLPYMSQTGPTAASISSSNFVVVPTPQDFSPYDSTPHGATSASTVEIPSSSVYSRPPNFDVGMMIDDQQSTAPQSKPPLVPGEDLSFTTPTDTRFASRGTLINYQTENSRSTTLGAKFHKTEYHNLASDRGSSRDSPSYRHKEPCSSRSSSRSRGLPSSIASSGKRSIRKPDRRDASSKLRDENRQLLLELAESKRQLNLSRNQAGHLAAKNEETALAWDHQRVINQEEREHIITEGRREITSLRMTAEESQRVAIQREEMLKLKEIECETRLREMREHHDRAMRTLEEERARAQQREAEMNHHIQHTSATILHERIAAQELSQKLDASKCRETQLAEDLGKQIQTFNAVKESSEEHHESLQQAHLHIEYLQQGVAAQAHFIKETQGAAETFRQQAEQVAQERDEAVEKGRRDHLDYQNQISEAHNTNVILSDENRMLSNQVSRSRSTSRSPERDQILENLRKQLAEKEDVVMSQARQLEMSKRRGAPDSDTSGTSTQQIMQEKFDAMNKRFEQMQAEQDLKYHKRFSEMENTLKAKDLQISEQKSEIKELHRELSVARSRAPSATRNETGTRRTMPHVQLPEYGQHQEVQISTGAPSEDGGLEGSSQSESEEDEDAPQQEEERTQEDVRTTLGSETVMSAGAAAAAEPEKTAKTDGEVKRCRDLKLPDFPSHAVNLSIWLFSLTNALKAASGYLDNKESKWIRETTTKTFEELAHVGDSRFQQLDSMLHNQLCTQMQRHNKDLYNRYEAIVIDKWHSPDPDVETTITGRQVVWLIQNHWTTTSAMKEVYTTKHLNDFPWYGDDKIEKFLTDWKNLLHFLKDHKDERTLKEYLYDKMIKSHNPIIKDRLKRFATDRTTWEMATQVPGTTADLGAYTYEFLISTLDRVIWERKGQAADQAMSQAIRGARQSRFNPAAPATDQKEAAKKPRGKSEPRQAKPTAKAKAKAEAKQPRSQSENRKPKAAAKAKPAVPAPPTPSNAPRPAKPTGNNLQDWCWFYNAYKKGVSSKPCKYSRKDCTKAHDDVADDVFKAAPIPGKTRSRTGSPAPAAPAPRGRNNQGKPRGGSPSGGRKSQSPSGRKSQSPSGNGKPRGRSPGKGNAAKREKYTPASIKDRRDEVSKKWSDYYTKNGKKMVYFCRAFADNKPCKFKKANTWCPYPHRTLDQVEKGNAKLSR